MIVCGYFCYYLEDCSKVNYIVVNWVKYEMILFLDFWFIKIIVMLKWDIWFVFYFVWNLFLNL